MATVIAIKPETAITPETKCDHCTNSSCCRYITQALDTPRSIDDFDMLLWQVSHEDSDAYKDDDGWFLLVNDSCSHLLPGGRCAIYEKRPQICREHDNDDCEFNDDLKDQDFELYFSDYESMDKYCRKRFKGWDKRFKRWEKRS